jgi:uncharacterized membrane protein (DUF2068 family)
MDLLDYVFKLGWVKIWFCSIACQISILRPFDIWWIFNFVDEVKWLFLLINLSNVYYLSL